MQEIIQDFLIWLLKFLAVSVGLLTAARIWTLKRRKKLLAEADMNLPQSAPGSPNPAWHRDAVLARMTLVLMFSVSALCLARLSLDGTGDWQPWAVWGAGTILAGGFGFLWLQQAKQGPLELRAIRRLADLFELAALRVSQDMDLESALNSTLEYHNRHYPGDDDFPLAGEGANKSLDGIEQLFGRISSKLKSRFQAIRKQASCTAGDLDRLSNDVQRALERRALGQAARVSSWAKFPLLASLVPVICLMLVTPFSEWALDHLTGNANSGIARPEAQSLTKPPGSPEQPTNDAGGK